MKKLLSAFFAAILLLQLVGCNSKKDNVVTITLRADGWEDIAALESLIDTFCGENPDIRVELSHPVTGSEAAETTEKPVQPDLVLQSIFAAEQAEGAAELSSLWTQELAASFHPDVLPLFTDSGSYNVYPYRVIPCCVGINMDTFIQTGAIQYIDTDNRTWSAEDFENVIHCLFGAGYQEIGIIPCVGIPQDHSTRALVSNLCGSELITDAATACTAENTRALQLLSSLTGIRFDTGADGNGEAYLFATGNHQISFCWDPTMERLYADRMDFDVFPMAFPTQSGTPRLYGDVFGFRLISGENSTKQNAAMRFLQWLAQSDVSSSEYDALTPYIIAPPPGEDAFREDWQSLLTAIANGTSAGNAISNLAGRIS